MIVQSSDFFGKGNVTNVTKELGEGAKGTALLKKTLQSRCVGH